MVTADWRPEAQAQLRAGLLARAHRRWESLRVWLELTQNLAVRDVETRYKHSLLGLYWALINPLITAGIFAFVFAAILHVSSKPIPYVVFLLAGLTFWNLFANGVSSATASITGSASLLAKLYFPRVVLPTASVAARLIDFLFSLFILVVFVLAYHVRVHWTVLWCLPLMVLQIAFTLGVAFATAALNVVYRDMTQLVGLLLLVWMYFSPVIYAFDSVGNALQAILLVNPMGALLQAYRDLMFVGYLTHPLSLYGLVPWTAFVLVGGLAAFKRIEPLFAEVM